MAAKALSFFLKGDYLRIVGVDTSKKAAMRKIMIFGLLPGAIVQVLQVSPVMVIRIDHTEVALDQELSALITAEKITS